MPKPLTAEEIAALDSIKDGADVYDPKMGRALRRVERKRPELICIGKAQTYKGDGTDVVPYFGVMATVRGKAFLAGRTPDA